MPSRVEVDDKLVNEVMIISGQKSKKAAVHEVLTAYVERSQKRGILDLFGKIEFDPDYDYKEQRRRR